MYFGYARTDDFTTALNTFYTSLTTMSQHIHKLVVFSIRQIQKCLSTELRSACDWRGHSASFSYADALVFIHLLLIDVVIMILHAVVDDLPRLAVLDSLALLEFVEVCQIDGLDDGAGGQSDEYAENRS